MTYMGSVSDKNKVGKRWQEDSREKNAEETNRKLGSYFSETYRTFTIPSLRGGIIPSEAFSPVCVVL